MGDIVTLTEEYVKHEMAGLDGSHDFHHIQRVKTLALRIAELEGNVDLEIVQLAALLHDIDDWKYKEVGAIELNRADYLLGRQGYDPEKTNKVVKIISLTSYKEELGCDSEMLSQYIKEYPELAVVQDADRLDALGAIGIARAFAFGGTRKSALHNPDIPLNTEKSTQDEYIKRAKSGGSTIQHFYDKLFHLKDMMKTESGKKIAQERHEFMVQFVDRFMEEWSGNM